MLTVRTAKNQTVFDLAAQHYGNMEAFPEVIVLNPGLKSDYTDTPEAGVDVNVLDLSYPLIEGQTVLIDDESALYKKSIISQMAEEKEIISFDKFDI